MRAVSIRLGGIPPRALVEGETVAITVTFRSGRNDSGELVDPENVQIFSRQTGTAWTDDPVDHTDDIELVGEGVYRLDVTFDEPGEWVFRIEAGEDWKGAKEHSFSVLTSRVLKRA